MKKLKPPSRAKLKKKSPKEKTSESFILETKLMPPVLKDNVISRTHLLSLLNENLIRKLVLIVAEAGYGKTTLLIQLLRDEKLPYVFYNLDKNDSDFLVFVAYLVHGLEQIQPELTARTRGLLNRGGEAVSNYELIMGTLINEIVEKRKQELFIILDDYHNLAENGSVHKALEYFIDHMPDLVHVIIASRSRPQLASLTKWQAKQVLYELTREGLKFSDDEIRVLLNDVYQIVLPVEELKRISEHVEGWITGIQLILQTAGKDGKTIKQALSGYLEANQPLFEYFANEILAGETLEVQDFLKRSSILETMSPGLCDTVLGTRDSIGLLGRLEKHNLFISAIGQGEYKYHHLFRDFLKRQIVNTKLQKLLELRAAAYYKKKNQKEQAIEHYLNAGRHEYAGKMIIQIQDDLRKKQARFATLKSWLNEIPERIYKKQPRLYVIMGTLSKTNGDFVQAEEYFLRAEQVLKQTRDSAILAEALLAHGEILWLKRHYLESQKILLKALRKCPVSAKNLKDHILNAIGLAFEGTGNWMAAKNYLLKAKNITRQTRNYPFHITVDNNLAVMFLKQGEVQLAFNLFKSLIERIGSNYRHGVGTIFSNAAKVALDFGQSKWAEEILKQGIALCQPYEDYWSQTMLYRGLGNLHMQKAEWAQSLSNMECALAGFKKVGWITSELIALCELGCIHRYQGNFEKAFEYIDQVRQKVENINSMTGLAILVELSSLQIATGQLKQAENSINASLKLIRKFGVKKEEFLVKLARAELCLRKTEEPAAIRLLGQAVRQAKSKGYHGILARELRCRPQLMNLLQRCAIERQYLGTLNLQVLSEDLSDHAMVIYLFGKYELLVHGVDKTSSLKGKFCKAIFSYFLLHPKRCFTWEEITAWAWPESPSAVAHQLFRNVLYTMRRGSSVIKAAIVYRNNRYSLNCDIQIWVDAWEFQNLLNQASAATKTDEKLSLLQKTINLYQGPICSGLYYPWIDRLQMVYKGQYIMALKSLAEINHHKQEYEKSIHDCLRLLGMDDLDESIHRLLIINYVRLGLKAKALDHYQHLIKIFDKKYGTKPTLETTTLIESFQ